MRYQRLGMQLRLKRVESCLHQKTLAILLGGATQTLIGWWESRYMPGDRYLGRINQFLGLDPMALRVYVLASGLKPRRRHVRKTKPPNGVLKMDQRTPFMSG